MVKYQDEVLSRTGDVVPNATITVYNAGTSTLSTLYANSAGTASLANPVTADFKGYFYFYAGTGTYDLTISGTGITTQQITDVQLSPPSFVYNIKDYGAKGNGSDDYTAIAAAISAAAAVNGTVYIPDGTYVVNTSLTIPDNRISIVGQSMEGAGIKAGAAMTAIFTKSTTTNIYGVQIKNLHLDGNMLATYAAKIVGGKGWILENIRVGKVANGGTGMQFGDATSGAIFYEAKFSRVSFLFEDGDYPVAANVPVYGLEFLATATDNHVNDLVCKNPLTAGYMDGGSHNQITCSHVYGFPLLAYYPSYGFILGTNATGVQLYSDGVNVAGVKLNASGGSLSSSIMFWPSTGMVSGAYPVEIAAGASSLTIANNYGQNTSGITSFVNFLSARGASTYIGGNIPTYDNLIIRNNSDQANSIVIDSGNSSAQDGFLSFKDRGGTKWNIKKTPGANTMTLEDGADSFKLRESITTAGTSEYNSGGTSAVQHNVRNGSGTGGTGFGDGAGNTVSSISSAGLGTFNGGLKAASGGTTIKQMRLFTALAVDPGSIAAASRGSIAVTVPGTPGIATGDVIIPVQGINGINDDLVFEGVTATGANQVTFFYYNPTAGAIDDGSVNWDVFWLDVT